MYFTPQSDLAGLNIKKGTDEHIAGIAYKSATKSTRFKDSKLSLIHVNANNTVCQHFNCNACVQRRSVHLERCVIVCICGRKKALMVYMYTL